MCFAVFMTSGLLPSRASAQIAPSKDFTYTDAFAVIRASGYDGPLKEHPAIITHVKQEAGPKLEALITQLRDSIKVNVEFDYGKGDQTIDFKPYKTKNFVLHSLGINADFPVMDGFMTMGESLDILEIPDIRNSIVKISTPKSKSYQMPKLTVRVGRSNQGVKLQVSEDIYTSETYVINGLTYDELIFVHLNGEILDAKTLFTF